MHSLEHTPSAPVHTSVLVLFLSPSLALNMIFPCFTPFDPLLFSRYLSVDNISAFGEGGSLYVSQNQYISSISLKFE